MIFFIALAASSALEWWAPCGDAGASGGRTRFFFSGVANTATSTDPRRFTCAVVVVSRSACSTSLYRRPPEEKYQVSVHSPPFTPPTRHN